MKSPIKYKTYITPIPNKSQRESKVRWMLISHSNISQEAVDCSRHSVSSVAIRKSLLAYSAGGILNSQLRSRRGEPCRCDGEDLPVEQHTPGRQDLRQQITASYSK